ncbi:MAG: DUF1566 domain-containing protein [Chitinophaga rupis]
MKILLFVFLTCMTLAGRAQRRDVAIGDSAFCGIVFYTERIVGSVQQRVLVCALQDVGTQTRWYNGIYKNTFAISDHLFAKGNADTIIIQQGDTGNYAALNATKIAACGDGWYLPSRAELNLVYKNLASKGIGQFANEGYWSSLEDAPLTNPSAVSGKTNAWIVDFYDGRPYTVDKSNTYHVRPIRAVTN